MNVLFVCADENELATCLFNVETNEFLLSTRHDISEDYVSVVHELDKTLMNHSASVDCWSYWNTKTLIAFIESDAKHSWLPDFWYLKSFCLKDEWAKQMGKMKLKHAMLSCGMTDFSDMSPYRKVHTMTTLNKFLDTSKYVIE